MKRLKKLLLWLTVVVAGLLILAIVGIKLFFPADKARALAVKQGSAALGRPLSVADIEISFWGGLGLRLVDIRVDNPDSLSGPPLLTADGLDLKLQLWPLLSNEIRLDRLIIDRPVVSAQVDADGRNNFTFKTTVADSLLSGDNTADMPDEVNAAAAAVSFDQLEINDGTIIYSDVINGRQMKITGLQLESQLETPRSDLYRAAGRIVLDSLISSDLADFPLFTLGINYSVQYDLTRRHLSIERAAISIGDAGLTLTGEVDTPLDTAVARLAVHADGLDLYQIIPLLPPNLRQSLVDMTVAGKLAIDADLHADMREDVSAWTYSGTATLLNVTAQHSRLASEVHLKRALIDFKPDNLRFTIEEGQFAGKPLKGHVIITDFDDPTFAGEVAGGLDLTLLQPLLPADNLHQFGGIADVDLKFFGRSARIREAEFSGSLRVVDGRYQSTLLPEPVEKFDCDIYVDRKTVNVRQLTARFASGELNVSGRVNDLVPWMLADSLSRRQWQPSFDGSLKGELDLGAIEPFLPERGDPSLNGRFSIDLQLVGSISEPGGIRPRGRLSISEASYTDSYLPEPITRFAAEMIITPDSIVVDSMKAEFTSSDLGFRGTLIKPFPYLLPFESTEKQPPVKPLFLFTLNSHRFDVDKLFPEAVPGSGDAGTGKGTDSVSIIFLPNIEARGILSADTVVYMDVELTAVTTKVWYRDGRMEFHQAEAEVYSGNIRGKTTIDLHDLENPHYVGEFNGTNIEADDFMSRFTWYKGHLSGKADISGGYDAAGWDSESFLNSLNVTGTGALNNGRIKTSGVLYTAMKEVAKRLSQPFAQEQPIRNLRTDFKVKDGRVTTDDLFTGLGDFGDMTIAGSYGFDSTIDYTLKVFLSEEHSKKFRSGSAVTNLLGGLLSSGEKGRILIPVSFGGTIDNPTYQINWSALGENIGDNLKDQAGQALQNLFNKKKD